MKYILSRIKTDDLNLEKTKTRKLEKETVHRNQVRMNFDRHIRTLQIP